MEKEILKGQKHGGKTRKNTNIAGINQKAPTSAGIDLSVVCPVATNTKQPEKINRLSVEYNEKMSENKIFYFGAIHPDCENYKEIIDDIVAMDLKAIKIHPDYQNTFFDDEKYLRLIDYAANKDLGIIVHAGEDVGFQAECIVPLTWFLICGNTFSRRSLFWHI